MKNHLKIYADLRDRDLRREGRFIAEGRFLVERLLSSPWEVESVLCSERMAEEINLLAEGRSPVYTLPDGEIEKITGFRFHRGVMAAGIRRGLPDTKNFLMEYPQAGKLVVCPDLTDAENLGSIFRSAAAFGVDGILIGPRSCDPLGRKSLKVSMGTVFTLPMIEMKDEAGDVGLLSKAGFHLYGTVLSENAVDLRVSPPAERSALVFGNEAAGLTDRWQEWCDTMVTLPMQKGTDSLNVAVSAGVFIYEMFYRNSE